jgi:hypothetical protein
MAHKNGGSLPERRPAETASPVAMALAMLVAIAFGWNIEVVAPLAIVVAFVPAAVTWVVELRRS